ncbi:methyltransferase domain protein [Ceratobasidium sp. AG-Ba]|nr:methyltransferase domain protein [Ceratobasidium sp. AG-Ba]
MALFESTWDTPSGLKSLTTPQDIKQGKKRKRDNGPTTAHMDVNLAKLMEKMAGVEATTSGQKKRDGKKTKKGTERDMAKSPSGEKGREQEIRRQGQGDKKTAADTRLDKKRNKRPSHSNNESITTLRPASPSKSAPSAGPSAASQPRRETLQSDSSVGLSSKKEKKRKRGEETKTTQRIPAEKEAHPPNGSLTALQNSMKSNLEGARFRFINEQLYKSSSGDARDMMRKEPQVYAEYHTGFRHQTKLWPINPVTLIASLLSSLPPRSLIVDLGCGDAQLAKTLVPSGLNVLSYDLVSDGTWVIEADICTKIPLPGSEADGEDAQAVADACVCSLSLMSTNWIGCVREAWRVLRIGGKFLIAEVTSRFQNTDEFVEVLAEVGFELIEQSAPSTHFLLFDFQKVSRDGKDVEDEWEAIQEKAQALLKACEYKRR